MAPRRIVRTRTTTWQVTETEEVYVESDARPRVSWAKCSKAAATVWAVLQSWIPYFRGPRS
jgi:hypothetical protein